MPLTFVIENAVRKRGGNDNDVEEEIANNCNSTTTAVTGTFIRGIQREYGSKPLKHSIVKRILLFKR